MSETATNSLEQLSPAKRALLEKWMARDGVRPSIPRRAGAEPAPLSFAQQRLWFLDRLEPENAIAYNIPLAVRLRGPLSWPALQGAVGDVMERHEPLRYRFGESDGVPYQTADLPATLDVARVDLGALPAEQRLSHAMALATAEAQRPMDLTSGPPWRLTVLGLETHDHVIIIIVHHIVADAWSLGVLLNDLVQAYHARLDPRAPRPAPLALRFSDFAAWQRAQSAAYHTQLEHWVNQLKGAAGLDLPTDKPRPPHPAPGGGIHTAHYPRPLLDGLNVLARATGSTLYMTLLAAFGVLLQRWCGQDDIVVGTPVAGRNHAEVQNMVGFFANTLVMRTQLEGDPTFRELLGRVRQTVVNALAHQDVPFETIVDALNVPRDPSRSALFQVVFALQNVPPPRAPAGELEIELMTVADGTAKFDLWLSLHEVHDGLHATFEYRTDLFESATMARMAGHLGTLMASALQDPDQPVSRLQMLTSAEWQQVVHGWNDTAQSLAPERWFTELFAMQVARTPQAPALVMGGRSISYLELDTRATAWASRLRALGVGPEVLVPICVARSFEMVIGMLAVLKTGGAYVPLDPDYPAERLTHVLHDLGAKAAPCIMTSRQLAPRFHDTGRPCLLLEDQPAVAEFHPPQHPVVHGQQTAYAIYTSGSTGRPKGVLVSHLNLLNFCAAMDVHFGGDAPGTWLALTSMSFDISILELLWTLTRGFKVVIQPELLAGPATQPLPANARAIDFSLFYFAGDAADGYRLLMEGAAYADAHGFAAVWTPERHFHAFGGLYPNPSVISAALAATTHRIKIRAGSVVLPLHHPLRVAEEWAVVDRLSNGRVGLAIASGWHADDFVFASDRYATRKAITRSGIETLQKLWRGDAVSFKGGAGNDVSVRLMPRPVQAEVPLWLTTSGNPDTFQQAGEMGLGVLTHLLGQTFDELALKLRRYREAWRSAGHAGEGHVVLMLHTFVGEHIDDVRAVVRQPLKAYLRTSLDLIRNLGSSLGVDIDANTFSPEDMDALLEHAFERYFATSGLIGTPDMCEATVRRLQAMEVDEIGCLIDFGVPVEAALHSLELLAAVRTRICEPPAPVHAMSTADLIREHAVSHIQCTPTLAALLVDDPDSRAALAQVGHVLLGGEALPLPLARKLLANPDHKLFNLYGPTETTIWSSLQPMRADDTRVLIGRPILNTRLHVLDKQLDPQPVGVTGELYIGGLGVARGYHGRASITADRFVPDPFSTEPGARLYRTGDLARATATGALEYLGRSDFQIKLGGHRIELGEIESVLRTHPAVREAVVVARVDAAGQPHLVGYVVVAPEAADASALRAHARRMLPEYMLPRHLVLLDALPRTPNNKLDRNALPVPVPQHLSPTAHQEPRSDMERRMAHVWADVLHLERISAHDNFFDLGGDSIVSLQLISRARRQGLRFTLAQLFKHQRLSELSAVTVLTDDVPTQAVTIAAVGPTALMPFPQWFFDLDLRQPHQWNQAILFKTRQRPDVRLLAQALAALMTHHDALRSRFVHSAAGWTQEILAAGPDTCDGCFEIIDLSAIPTGSETALLEAEFERLQASLHLEHGPLLRAAYVDLGPGRDGRFFMVAHHLVVDGVSWRVLIEDLQSTYLQLAQSATVRLPTKGTSLRQWTRLLQDYVQRGALIGQREYWRSVVRKPVLRLPVDFPDQVADEAQVTFKISRLTRPETDRLLTHTLGQLGVQINDVLVTALVHTLSKWCGGQAFTFDMEGHGREALTINEDLTHMVGWLATYFPVHIETAEHATLLQTLASVRQQLTAIPERGFGFGLLRSFDPDAEVRAALRGHGRSELRLNYLGQFNHMFDPNAPFVAGAESIGYTRHPSNARPYVIEINGGVFDGELELAWVYSRALHRRETIETLARSMADTLRELSSLAPAAPGGRS